MSKTRTVQVTTAHTSYPITIGTHLDEELVRTVKKEGEGRRVAVIADSTVSKLIAAGLLSALKHAGISAELLSFPKGEQNKNQKNVSKLQHEMLKRKFGRDSFIVALGGGVTGDLAGFVAATYMRGIPYIQVPTTMLAMVDSSVGGKVGINTPYGKNTVGAFWQPRAVLADLSHLAHLPKKEFISGLLEAVKTFITSDESALQHVEKLDLNSPLRTAGILADIVSRSVEIKSCITGRDERENGERLVVNFGHTIGHAVELLSDFKIPHGFAVGYGMLVEAKIAELAGRISSADFSRIEALLKRLGVTSAVLSKYSIDKILKVAQTDKKSKHGIPHYVLLSGVGSVHTKDGKYAHPVGDDIVRSAYELCLSR